jgi:peroxiredoxin
MKKIIVLIFGLLAISATAAAQNTDTDANTLVKAGMTAPEFTVKMLDGSEINLADLRGKIVLLNFWATWCPYCIQELNRVQADIIDKFKGKDLVFIAVSRGEEKAVVEKFAKLKNYKFPIGLDGDESIFKKYATRSIPRNFVIDRDGKVILSEMGYSPELFAQLVECIEGAL